MKPGDETLAQLTRAGLNLIQQALSIFDRDLKLVLCNRRYREMFDFPEAYVTPGTSFEETIRYLVGRGEYGEVADPEEAVRTRVDAALAFVPHYLERARPDGRWISVEGAPLTQGGWVTVYTDITEIKLQEQMLRSRSEELSDRLLAHSERLAATNRALSAANSALEEAKRELTELEARTRLTTEMMPAHIAHVGPDLRYTFSNRKLSSVIPGRPSDIVGLTGREALGEQSFARIEPYLHRALAGEASVFEFSDDDSGRRIRAAFTPDRTGDGPIHGVYILSMDVTEETQARAALTQTRKRELAAQLTSGLAHDFANLLTVILGLQSRLDRLDLPPEAREMVASTRAAARRGGTLLDRIATISGRREPRPVATDLAAFMADLGALARPALPERIALEIGSDNFDGPVMLDAGGLQDSLLNLILNAKDAIGGGSGHIAVTARPVRDTWIEFTVSDDGPGFSESALEKALDPFFTTKGGEGSGLGLSMVYDQTSLSGGTVKLENLAKGGARVLLRLPYRKGTKSPRTGLVLLVEDNEDIRTTVREMLRAVGHSVLEAASADEAEALIALPGLDLVLTDITLPGRLTGVDLAEQIGARDGGPSVGLMTSLPPANPLRARAAARFPVLAKPFDATMLATFLTSVRP